MTIMTRVVTMTRWCKRRSHSRTQVHRPTSKPWLKASFELPCSLARYSLVRVLADRRRMRTANAVNLQASRVQRRRVDGQRKFSIAAFGACTVLVFRFIARKLIDSGACTKNVFPLSTTNTVTRAVLSLKSNAKCSELCARFAPQCFLAFPPSLSYIHMI